MMKAGKLSFLLAVLLIFGSGKLFSQDLLVSGGNTVSTIICANGFVYTWGSNDGGQLGNGSASNPEMTPKQVTFPADAYFTSLGTNLTIKAVDAGSGAHFIALDCQGGAWSWGNNGGGTGITGTGAVTAQTSVPARVLKGETPGGAAIHASLANYLVNVKYISGGNDNSYAILNTGEAVGWGVNSSGQVGDGTYIAQNAPRYIRTADGLTLKNVIQIEAGDVTGYAIVDPDGDGLGTVYSWGSGANSRLGRNNLGTGNNGSETANDNYARPVLRLNGTPLDNIKIISAGDVMCFAMDINGFVWAWGNGGWGDCTGVGVSGLTHSDPRQVVAGEWGTTAGPGFGQQYLKAKAISGGQGYGMAVTTNGIPVAWGNNGACGSAGGGNLGNGSGAQSGSPVFIRRSAGTYDNNVIGISDGDTWGFYTTSTGDIYTWGNNNVGQLGLGNTTCQNYATLLTVPCALPAPKPSASILPRDMSVCSSTFTSVLLDSKFIIGTALDQDYKITWSKNGTPVQTLTADQAGALTYNATTIGTYHVKVEYIGSDAPCAPYTPAEDEIDITAYVQNYTVPSPLTFCGTLTPYVNGLGRYNWYKDPTGGSSLATTLKNNPASIPKASVNAPAAGVYTVYVQETGAYAGNVGPVTPTSCTGITSNDVNNWRNIIITVKDPQIFIDTVTIWVKGETGAAKTWNWQVNAYPTKKNGSNQTVGDFSGAAFATGVVSAKLNPSNGGNWVETKIPVNITLPGNGATYAITVPRGIQTSGVNNPNLADFNCSLFPKNDDISTGGPYVTATDGSDFYTNKKTEWGPIGNIHFSTSQQFCDRVPVTLTESCPCAPPTALGVTPSATTTLCQGANQTITGTYTLGTPTTGYNFVWYKGTAPASPTYTAIASYADYSITGALPADAGTYTLRIEDGTSNNSACYREASVTIVVNATTVPGVVAADQTICNGNTANALTSTTAASGGNGTTYNYQWQSSTDNISFSNVASAGTSATYSPGAITQTTYYRRTVTSGSVCPTVNSNTITITVNPALTAGSIDASQSICSSTSPNALTELTAATGGGGAGTYTYQWQSSPDNAAWTNIGSATATTYAPPTLTATTYYRRVVSSGTCTSQNSNVVTITVLPGLSPGTITATQSICYNTTPTALSSTAAASGGAGAGTYVYSWEESTNGGTSWSVIGGQSGLTYTPPTLTATTLYRRVVVSGTGTCNTANTTPVTITVYGPLTVGAIAADQPICSGVVPATLTNATTPTGGSGSYGYVWEQSTNGGTSWSTVSGAISSSYSPPALTATTMYRRTVTSSTCGSLTTTPVTITVTNNVPVSVTINDPGATCAGSPMSFTATPTNAGATPTYQWYVNGFTAGTGTTFNSSTLVNNDKVEVILTSSITCVTGSPANSNAVTVQVLSNVTPSITISDPVKICTGTSVTFNVLSSSGGGATPTYQWYLNGAPVGTGTTSYTNGSLTNGNTVRVVMTSSLGCAVTPTGTSNLVTMNVAAIPTPQILGTDTTFCSGLSVNYSSLNGGGTLTWYNNGSPVGNGASIAITSSGVYTLNENNGACATTSAPVNVTVSPTPTVNAGTDVYVKEGDPITLNASGAVNYTWTPSTGLSNPNTASPSLNPYNSQEYTVIGYDATNKCYTSDVMKVFVEKLISIPNAFTPNGDNNNDGWEIANIESFPNCKIEVYNRWGNLVWKSSGYALQWDGSNFRNGEALPDGTYFYVIDLQSKIFTEPYTGYVQIVK